MTRSTLIRRDVLVAALVMCSAATMPLVAQGVCDTLPEEEIERRLEAYQGVVRTDLEGGQNGDGESVPIGDPEHVQAADLDGDGDLDLVSANAGSDNLAVFFQDEPAAPGGPRFPLEHAISLADSEGLRRPRWVRAVDLDGDSRLDLAAASYDGAAVVLFYQTQSDQGPAGEFPRSVTLPLPDGEQGDAGPTALTAGDLNGDDFPDLALTDARNDRIHVLLQSPSDGLFQASVPVKVEAATHRIEVADLDRTGGPDLVVLSSFANRVTFLQNYDAAQGAFASPSPSPLQLEAGSLPQSMQVLDLIGDGRAGLAIAAYQKDEIQLFTAASEGEVPRTRREPLPVAPGPVAVAFHQAAGELVSDHLAVAAFRSSAVQLVRRPLEARSHASWGGDRGPKAVVAADLGGGPESELIAANLAFDKLSVHWDVSALEGSDVDQSGVLDACEVDCTGNGLPDAFELARGAAEDCDQNGVPDACDLVSAPERDCDHNGVLDACDLQSSPERDCDSNGVLDTCDLQSAPERDCDSNGMLDACEIAVSPEFDCDGSLALDFCEVRDGKLPDTDGDGIPNVCEDSRPLFHRGDADGNGVLELTDSIRILSHLFLGGPAPLCLDIADADDNGSYQLTDAVRILSHLFLGALGPAAPGPPGEPCGPDPTPDDLGDDESCAGYGHC